MDFKIPVKRSALYTEPLGLRIEKELKHKIAFLDGLECADRPDVPELLRIGIRDVVEKAYKKFSDAG